MSRLRALICALLLGVILCGLILIFNAVYSVPVPPPVEFKTPVPSVPAKTTQECPTFPINFWCTVRTI